jgi:predicted Zn-dependent peptidase
MNKTFTTETINGQRYQFLTLPGTNIFKIEIVNLIGSNIERTIKKITGKNLYGIAHFIEHLGFHASKDYTTDELGTLIKNEGWYNASTDYNRINYWFKTTNDRMELAIKLVCNFALNDLTKIPQNEFDMENKVVYNEAKRYADDDQTMFRFNTTRAACGYEMEDTVIGVPSTISTFTLDDVIAVKEILLNYGEHVINVTYDPTVSPSRDEIVNCIETQVDRFKQDWPFSVDIWQATVGRQVHNDTNAPLKGSFQIDNEANQAMTALIFDTIKDIIVAHHGNNYLAHYAIHSLTDVIREKNGLTYHVAFGADIISFKPYTIFGCDVTRGDEGKLIELVKLSLNQACDDFDANAYSKLLRGVKLDRALHNLNLNEYDSLFWLGIMYPTIPERYKRLLSQDLDAANEAMSSACSYIEIKEYIESIRDAAASENWTRVYT